MFRIKIDHLLATTAAFLAVGVLGGCSNGEDGGSADADGSSAGETLANPVALMKRIDGCEVEAGAEVGEADIDGNRYATCTFEDGTSIVARTYPGDPSELATAEQLQSDDSHKVIVGDDFTVVITGEFVGEYATDVDPEAVAGQVGGEYLAPS